MIDWIDVFWVWTVVFWAWVFIVLTTKWKVPSIVDKVLSRLWFLSIPVVIIYAILT